MFAPVRGPSALNVRRDHCKASSSDNEIAELRGMNFGARYLAPVGDPDRDHDISLRMRGPVVLDFTKQILDSREACGAPPIPEGEWRVPPQTLTPGNIKCRLLHHADTLIIEGKSYRMKDQIEAP